MLASICACSMQAANRAHSVRHAGINMCTHACCMLEEICARTMKHADRKLRTLLGACRQQIAHICIQRECRRVVHTHACCMQTGICVCSIHHADRKLSTHACSMQAVICAHIHTQHASCRQQTARSMQDSVCMNLRACKLFCKVHKVHSSVVQAVPHTHVDSVWYLVM